ncbi:hypothetical protein DFH27DRAFT_198125 [Peziza echinospora]|nr:hypothetical protein DFH27DRAFT_198125 [Peziza echinospora]
MRRAGIIYRNCQVDGSRMEQSRMRYRVEHNYTGISCTRYTQRYCLYGSMHPRFSEATAAGILRYIRFNQRPSHMEVHRWVIALFASALGRRRARAASKGSLFGSKGTESSDCGSRLGCSLWPKIQPRSFAARRRSPPTLHPYPPSDPIDTPLQIRPRLTSRSSLSRAFSPISHHTPSSLRLPDVCPSCNHSLPSFIRNRLTYTYISFPKRQSY